MPADQSMDAVRHPRRLSRRYSRQNVLSFLAALLLCASAWITPAPAAASSSGFTQVSADEYDTCAVKEDGSIACWGDNSFGQATPPNPNSGFTQVSAGNAHTCALKEDGSIACWGYNDDGQTTVPDPNSGFTQVSVGAFHTCAVKGDGSIACWGHDADGRATPPTPNSGFTQVSAGNGHNCALKSDGSIVCWGDNSLGQATPPNPNSGFTQVSAGIYHTCAVKEDGTIACWGYHDDGIPTLPDPNSGFIQVSAGRYFTCAVKGDGSIACWGENWDGQASPPAPNSGFTQVSAGNGHTCAVKEDGSIACWGYHDDILVPTISLSPELPASIAYGDSYTQALTASGGPGGAPYTFDVVDGSLPPGLALSTTGTLSGTPTQVGSFTFTLRALDAIHYLGTRVYTLDIPRAPLTVRADDLLKPYGSPNPPLTYSFVGLKNGDGPGAVSGTPLLTTDAATFSAPGEYPITITGSLTADNYDITYAPGTLRIESMQLYLPGVLR